MESFIFIGIKEIYIFSPFLSLRDFLPPMV